MLLMESIKKLKESMRYHYYDLLAKDSIDKNEIYRIYVCVSNAEDELRLWQDDYRMEIEYIGHIMKYAIEKAIELIEYDSYDPSMDELELWYNIVWLSF